MSQVKRIFMFFYPPAGSELCAQIGSYLLRSGRHYRPLRSSLLRLRPCAFLHHPGLQPFLDEPENPAVGHAMLHELEYPFVGNGIEKSPNVGVKNVVHMLHRERTRERVQRLMLAASRSKAIREA